MSKRGKGHHGSAKRRKPDFKAGLGGGAVFIGPAAMLVSSPVGIAQAAATMHSEQASAFKTSTSLLVRQAGGQSAPWASTCGPVGAQGPQGGSGQGSWNCSPGNQGSQGAPGTAAIPQSASGTKGLPPCTP